ncbi:MAG: acyl carrier protein [bacterium]
MQEQEILQKVKEVVAERLGVEIEKVTPQARYQEDLNADSLDVVDLVMALEDAFQVKIPDADAGKIKTVQETVDYLKKALKGEA